MAPHDRIMVLTSMKAVRKCGFLYAGYGTPGHVRNKRNDMEYEGWQTGNYRAKLAPVSFRTARPGLAVSGKIILAPLRYFSRKPCISGDGRCDALVVHRAARPEYPK